MSQEDSGRNIFEPNTSDAFRPCSARRLLLRRQAERPPASPAPAFPGYPSPPRLYLVEPFPNRVSCCGLFRRTIQSNIQPHSGCCYDGHGKPARSSRRNGGESCLVTGTQHRGGPKVQRIRPDLLNRVSFRFARVLPPLPFQRGRAHRPSGPGSRQLLCIDKQR